MNRTVFGRFRRISADQPIGASTEYLDFDKPAVEEGVTRITISGRAYYAVQARGLYLIQSVLQFTYDSANTPFAVNLVASNGWTRSWQCLSAPAAVGTPTSSITLSALVQLPAAAYIAVIVDPVPDAMIATVNEDEDRSWLEILRVGDIPSINNKETAPWW